MSDQPTPLVLRGVERSFIQGDRRLNVLRGASLELKAGEIVALVGPSGSGKSTLLHIAGLLERPNAGQVILDGRDSVPMSDRDRTALRGRFLGFVYQYHHLLPEFSALENVMLPQMLNGLARAEARKRATELLAMVRLQERGDHRPGKLSGGEQQRVAIARALANDPALVLLDEPTGDLDTTTGREILGLLQKLNKEEKVTLLVATHDAAVAAISSRVVKLRDGKIESDAANPT